MLKLMKDREFLELFRNIIRETLLGNAAMILLVSQALLLRTAPLFILIVFGAVFILATSTVLLWMISTVTHYFNDMQQKYGNITRWVMILWAVAFEASMVIAAFRLFPW